MTNKEFVSQAKTIVNMNTAYGKGTFGQKWTKTLATQKKKQYPEFYTDAVIDSFNKKYTAFEKKAKRSTSSIPSLFNT